jgi:hypothetical protein
MSNSKDLDDDEMSTDTDIDHTFFYCNKCPCGGMIRDDRKDAHREHHIKKDTEEKIKAQKRTEDGENRNLDNSM